MPISNTLNPIKPFVLLSKRKGMPITPNSDLPERIGHGFASSVDIVEIGEVADPSKKRIVTTFNNRDKKPVEKIFEYIGYDDKPEVHRVYDDLVGDFVKKGRWVETFENLDVTGKFKAWKKVASQRMYVSKSMYTSKPDWVTIAKVSTDERFLNDTVKEHHSLTEYRVPSTYLPGKPFSKFIKFDTEKDAQGIPRITSICATEDVKIPEDDKYLALRLYDAHDVKLPIAKTALRENGLGNLDIPVEFSPLIEGSTKGSFYSNDGKILFNEAHVPKHSAITTGFHEAKHAQQYAIMAISGEGEMTTYAKHCIANYDCPVTPEIKELGKEYAKADIEYIDPKVNYEKYKENKLEEEAWGEGGWRMGQYFEKGRELSNQFVHFLYQEL
jgi:hypothetical protein